MSQEHLGKSERAHSRTTSPHSTQVAWAVGWAAGWEGSGRLMVSEGFGRTDPSLGE